MAKYIMRLDDACEKRNLSNWKRMEQLLDQFSIRPLVGVIPKCEDPMMAEYLTDNDFWETVLRWQQKGWEIALHGYTHVYATKCGGLNPVNGRSEFAGVSLSLQKEKITDGVRIMCQHGVKPRVFFAPAHTFDKNTIRALVACSEIRVISDTVAHKPYSKWGILFVPQQSGEVRRLPFETTTFCYHPNTMTEDDFERLERFLEKYSDSFIDFPCEITKRKLSLWDRALRVVYFICRIVR